MGIVFKNNAKTTLSSGVNNSTTTIPVTEGSVFPAVDLAGSETFFLMTLDDDINNEIVKVTTCSGNSGNINLTVVRAQEGTSARAFSSGNKAELRFTSGTIDHIRSDNTVHTNIFTTANASTTAFTLNQAVTNENDLVVFIDGVFQAHNTYTVSDTTLTLATAPASGRVVTAYSIKGLRSATNVVIATMTGDNSDTTLTLPLEPINENSVQVFFDGVYQNKSTFSVSGTTLTFSTAPPTGVEVEAILLTQTNIDTAAILKDADGDTKVQVEESSDEDKIRFDTGGTERAIIDSTGLGIGTSSPSAPLTVSTTGSGDAVIIESTEAGSSNAPDLVLHRNSASPADDDSLGIIRFRGENDASQAIDLINIFGQVTDVSDGSEDSTLYFKTYKDGAEQSPLTLAGGDVLIGNTFPSGNYTDASMTPSLRLGNGVNIGIGFNRLSISTSASAVFDTSNISNDGQSASGGDGLYMFTLVRTGGSYGTRFVGILGVDDSVCAIVETLENENFTVTTSGTVLSAAISYSGSAISCVATLQPLAIGE